MKKIIAWLLLLCSAFALFGCDDEEALEPKINIKANYTFFPTEKSDLNREELKTAYQSYTVAQDMELEAWGNYEIFNYVSQTDSDQYDLDIFQVHYADNSLYYVKHKDAMYPISPFPMNNQKSHCINHVAITDINNDGYIEILTAILSFSDQNDSGTSFVQVTDTRTGHSIDITEYDTMYYFKENKDGVISIYNTNCKLPASEDLQNGKLNEQYYDFAHVLFDVPVLNTSNYEFKERSFKTSCDLYSVEITVTDNSIRFPYLLMFTQTPISFEINVKMTYLGEPFSYISPDTYLDGATVSFVNGSNTIVSEKGAVNTAITQFDITQGMIIDRTYRYNDDLKALNEVGVYDMVITYENEEADLKESIVIEDFLKISRQ